MRGNRWSDTSRYRESVIQRVHIRRRLKQGPGQMFESINSPEIWGGDRGGCVCGDRGGTGYSNASVKKLGAFRPTARSRAGPPKADSLSDDEG